MMARGGPLLALPAAGLPAAVGSALDGAAVALVLADGGGREVGEEAGGEGEDGGGALGDGGRG